MLNRRRVARESRERFAREVLLMALSLIFGGLFAVQNTAAQSAEEARPATAQASSDQQTQPSQTAANDSDAAAVAVSHDGDGASSDSPAPSGQAGGAAPASASDSDSGWTPATAINNWLPQWLKLSGEFRDRIEGHTAYGFVPGDNDQFDLTRTRLGLDFAPDPYFHAFVQARDSEAFGEENIAHITTSMKDVFDLNQAYIEFRNGDNGWFSLKAGRQELQFGDQRLLGVSNWSNATRSWDMVRLSLGSDNVGPWLNNIGARLDLFAGSVVKNYYTSFDEPQAGHNFYGFNLALTKIIPKATIEPYVYLKTVPSVTAVDKKKGDERLYTSGVRVAGTIPDGFDYRARYSHQSGNYSVDGIDAWAGYGILGYTIPGTRFQPRFSIEYNYASGNKSIGSATVGTFDLLYPTTHQWDRITDLFGEENIRDLKPGFDFRPARKLKVRFVYSDLHLASRYDSLYDTTGAVLVKVPKGGALSTAIGNEADVYGTYDINKRLQIGAGYGYLVAGEFLKQNSPGANSSYPYGFVDYNF
jgi:hypothetical protein